MKCPVCSVDLVMTERQGVEIDYCPQCRGVWLDRGELDKIIDRSEREDRDEPRRDDPRREDPRRYEGDKDWKHDKPYGKRKKKGLLSELFEFGD